MINWNCSSNIAFKALWYNVCHYHRLDIAFATSCKPSLNGQLYWLPLSHFLDRIAVQNTNSILHENVKAP